MRGVFGAGDSHRFDVDSMVMLKDNHVDLSSSQSIQEVRNLPPPPLLNCLFQLVESVRKVASFAQKIEVETRNETEALEAARSTADVIMLDNFSPTVIRQWYDRRIVAGSPTSCGHCEDGETGGDSGSEREHLGQQLGGVHGRKDRRDLDELSHSGSSLYRLLPQSDARRWHLMFMYDELR